MDADRSPPSSLEKAPAPRRRPLLWLAVLLLAAIGGLFLWKAVESRRAENRLEEALAERTEALLALSSIPLGFAVRSTALEGNLGEIGAYFDRLVAEPGVEGVVYADAGGTIRVATDQALVGQALSAAYPGTDFAAPAAVVVRDGERWQAVVPVTGLNERLGIVVLTYSAARPTTEE